MTNLNGKTALVTGSTSGIGLGIALSLAKAGANLILNGFGDASAVIAQVQAFGGKVGHHPADVSDPAQIADMFAYAEREFGGVDILVNNAGIQHVAAVEEFPVERWDAIIAINLSSVFHSTRLSLPRMKLDCMWSPQLFSSATRRAMRGPPCSSALFGAHPDLHFNARLSARSSRRPSAASRPSSAPHRPNTGTRPGRRAARVS